MISHLKFLLSDLENAYATRELLSTQIAELTNSISKLKSAILDVVRDGAADIDTIVVIDDKCWCCVYRDTTHKDGGHITKTLERVPCTIIK